ncbi:MAG: response regulator, partial [Caulobacterales bacterium]|nr:response regulator [Caulobacterales bacterium]
MDGLAGKRILVVEDESLVAMLIETILEDLGCTPVGPVASVEDGLALAKGKTVIDAALLDVNVGGRQVFPVAEALAERGVPFIFSTGYGEAGLPDAWRGRPTLQ